MISASAAASWWPRLTRPARNDALTAEYASILDRLARVEAATSRQMEK